MPRRAAHHVQWSAEVQRYTIWIDCAHAQEQITPDSRSWFDWLEEIRSFAFSSRAGERCTALKERVQRGDAYWYGYRSLHGRTVKRYLGRTRDLSTTRLEEIAALLADESPSRHQVPRQNQGKALSQSTQAPSTHQGKAEAGIFLLVSKLQPPRLPAPLIDRGELFASLETSLTHALTLIQTPAGFGKTTLVTQWLARNQVRDDFPAVGWVSLDAGDNDVLRFWRYVITACQGKQPSLGENALSSLSASAPSPFVTPSLATVLTLLLNDLAQQEHAGLLVLDDYQVITEPTIHETLTFFLEHLPTTFHVLLLTQAEPPLPLLRWRAGENSENYTTPICAFRPRRPPPSCARPYQFRSQTPCSPSLTALWKAGPPGCACSPWPGKTNKQCGEAKSRSTPCLHVRIYRFSSASPVTARLLCWRNSARAVGATAAFSPPDEHAHVPEWFTLRRCHQPDKQCCSLSRYGASRALPGTLGRDRPTGAVVSLLWPLGRGTPPGSQPHPERRRTANTLRARQLLV
ncbi:hypothetical protein [Thermosporothrix hazakensis]|uniref:hypothetical protein n=1 Tax=Thermosporothrix hazakensis TaxID=644383 RepID=UPI001FE81996|nr:hypothetical protein [Thermosporothrix hazakensis]